MNKINTRKQDICHIYYRFDNLKTNSGILLDINLPIREYIELDVLCAEVEDLDLTALKIVLPEIEYKIFKKDISEIYNYPWLNGKIVLTDSNQRLTETDKDY